MLVGTRYLGPRMNPGLRACVIQRAPDEQKRRAAGG
jgi:hypothetical protein